MMHEAPPGRRQRPVQSHQRNPLLRRPWLPALLRGAFSLCPACGQGALFARGFGVVKTCATCGEELYHHRANRLSVPVAALLALQLVVLLASLAELAAQPLPLWLLAGLWLAASVAFLRPVKGAIVGLQWALRLHGFQYAAMCRPRRPFR